MSGSRGDILSPLGPQDPRMAAGYSLLARIGEGGMGTVYLSHTRGGQPVALKVIRREYGQDPDFRRRFEQEVQAARRVQGYHIVPVVDHDTTGELPWLASTFIPGIPLHDALAAYGPLPLPATFQLVGCAARALTAVHAVNVVHRDLKPSNILLGPAGPYVIDFGIARAADATQLTQSGGLIGTPQYMSPEHALGEPVGPATDVFSLGLIAAVAATGRHPYGDGGAITIAAQIANTAHRPPDLSGYPEQLRTVLERCLTPDPAERIGTEELAARCQEAAGRTLSDTAGWLPEPLAAEIARREQAARTPPPPAGTEAARPAVPPVPPPGVPPVTPPAAPSAPPQPVGAPGVPAAQDSAAPVGPPTPPVPQAPPVPSGAPEPSWAGSGTGAGAGSGSGAAPGAGAGPGPQAPVAAQPMDAPAQAAPGGAGGARSGGAPQGGAPRTGGTPASTYGYPPTAYGHPPTVSPPPGIDGTQRFGPPQPPVNTFGTPGAFSAPGTPGPSGTPGGERRPRRRRARLVALSVVLVVAVAAGAAGAVWVLGRDKGGSEQHSGHGAQKDPTRPAPGASSPQDDQQRDGGEDAGSSGGGAPGAGEASTRPGNATYTTIFTGKTLTIRSPDGGDATDVDLDEPKLDTEDAMDARVQDIRVTSDEFSEGGWEFFTTVGNSTGSTAQDCVTGAETNALPSRVPAQDIAEKNGTINEGDRLCTITQDGNLAMFEITDVIPGEYSFDTPTVIGKVTLWRSDD